MRKISYWRYSAVNLKTLFAALACALLVFSMLGCGTSNVCVGQLQQRGEEAP